MPVVGQNMQREAATAAAAAVLHPYKYQEK
jgi:hypothetical protein